MRATRHARSSVALPPQIGGLDEANSSQRRVKQERYSAVRMMVLLIDSFGVTAKTKGCEMEAERLVNRPAIAAPSKTASQFSPDRGDDGENDADAQDRYQLGSNGTQQGDDRKERGGDAVPGDEHPQQAA